MSETVFFGTTEGVAFGVAPLSGVSAFTDATGAVTTSAGSEVTQTGTRFNYDIVVQVPIPYLQLNFDADLIGDFLLPALTTLSVPRAILNFIAKAPATFDKVNQDIIDLMRAIPEATVTVLVRIGSVIVVNLRFVAEKTPIPVTPPQFILAAPNFAADPNISFTVPFPAPVAFDLFVPVPVPQIVNVPILSISGGHVSSQAGATVAPGPHAGAVGGVAVAPIEGQAAAIPPLVPPISLPTV